MKKNILFFTVLFCSYAGYSQTSFLQKSKRQKTAAWICLGGGIAVSTIGLSQVNVAGSDNGKVNNTPGTILFATGIAATLTSIPLFIASAKNKKKTATAVLNNMKIYSLNAGTLTIATIPAIALKINF
jgi:cytochrome bd-type quinol oxidase subunit 2